MVSSSFSSSSSIWLDSQWDCPAQNQNLRLSGTVGGWGGGQSAEAAQESCSVCCCGCKCGYWGGWTEGSWSKVSMGRCWRYFSWILFSGDVGKFINCFFLVYLLVENLEHCDFIALRNMVIRTHLHDLKDVTNNVHYENYRCRKLAGLGNDGKSGRLSNK